MRFLNLRLLKDCATALLLATQLIISGPIDATEIRVAVASNFKATMTSLVTRFEANSNHSVILIIGSTGKHYAQIKNGAPFDLFFAADKLRPQLLDIEGVALANSRFTYAVGKLLLWSATKGYLDNQASVLRSGNFNHLAIANPKFAPYGIAAQEVLQELGLWDDLSRRLVRGENIAQAFQFVNSGNAELGFVANSQLVAVDRSNQGSYWLVPQTLYTPIEQQAIMLKDSVAARAFMEFIKSPEALNIILKYGYDRPK